KGPLYRYFLRQAARHTAEDLYQETWLRIVNGAERYVPAAPFAAFLYRVAHSVLVDHWRRSGRLPASVPDENLPEPADPAEPIDVELDRETLRTRLAAAIE